MQSIQPVVGEKDFLEKGNSEVNKQNKERFTLFVICILSIIGAALFWAAFVFSLTDAAHSQELWASDVNIKPARIGCEKTTGRVAPKYFVQIYESPGVNSGGLSSMEGLKAQGNWRFLQVLNVETADPTSPLGPILTVVPPTSGIYYVRCVAYDPNADPDLVKTDPHYRVNYGVARLKYLPEPGVTGMIIPGIAMLSFFRKRKEKECPTGLR